MARHQTYKVLIGERAFELVLSGDEISLVGLTNNIAIDRLSNNTYALILDNKPYKVFIESVDDKKCVLTVNGVQHKVSVKDERDQLLEMYGVADSQQSVEKEVRAPMPGLVLDILIREGEDIDTGNGLLVLEAMKMENEIRSSAPGTIAKIHVKAGDPVAKGDLLIEIEPAKA